MTFDPKELRALVDDLQLVAKCLKGENKFPTGQSVILEAAAHLTAALEEIERLRAALGNAADSLDEAFRALGNAGEALGDEGPSREEARAFLAAGAARAALKGKDQ